MPTLQRFVLGSAFNHPPLSHENVSKGRRDYRSYYSDDTRKIVERYFMRDIRNFGYEF